MTQTNSFKVLNASAGSGKTYSLVKEYITVLLKSNSLTKFRNLLAITFTNKAVAEMKERVLDTLTELNNYKEGQDKPAMLDDLIATSGLSTDIIVNKSGQILDKILHNYSAFDIVTIDTLTHRIIRTFAKDLDISGSFEVSLDQQTHNAQAVDALIAKIGLEKEVTEVLVNFAIDKADDDKSWDITRDLIDIAQLLHNENDIKALEALKDKSLSEFIQLSKKLNAEITKLAASQKQIATELLDFIHALGLDQKSFKGGYFYNFIVDVSEGKKKISYVGNGKTYKDQIEAYDFYNKSHNDEIKSIIDINKGTFISTFFKLKSLSGRQQLFKAFKSKLIPLSVLQLIKKELEHIKEEENILLISDFNKLIAASLRDQPAAFLYERLGERYTNFFIDEFQDTSILQWNNLIPLIENSISTLSEDLVENSLLLVGDPKQAIYRWRGGEAEQFIDLSSGKNPFSIPAQTDQLDTNYRSHAEVINFNNSFFTHISSHFDTTKYKAIYFTDNDQKLNHRAGGYVSLDFIDFTDRAEADIVYPERVLNIINKVTLDGFLLSDICVLTRNNSHGGMIAQYLEKEGISIISSESLLVHNSPIVQFIHAFLTMIVYRDKKEKRLPVLYFLSDYLQIEQPHQFYKELLGMSVSEMLVYLQRFDIFIHLEHLQTLTLYESVEYIIQRFALQEKGDAYVLAYLDLVYNYVQKSDRGILGFLDYYDEKKEKAAIVAPPQKEAVQIMSIHKSKGLEFPIVIYPYADTSIYRTQGEHQWYPLQNETEVTGFSLLMVPHSSKMSEFGDIGKSLYEQKHSEQQFDSLNVLYVALTRAVERLYVVSRFRESVKNISTLTDLFIDFLQKKQLWNVEQRVYTFGSPDKAITKLSDSEDLTVTLPFISSSKEDLGIQIATQAAFLWDDEKQNAINYGNLIHNLMAEVKYKEDIPDVLDNAHENGLISSSEKDIIEKIIYSIVQHPSLQDCFEVENEVITERVILSSNGEFHIPDRVETTPEGHTTVIDYKTGAHNSSHITQISAYSKLLLEMGYQVEKNLLVYINTKVEVITV
ncbi:UvrD-helicase domain-containing protein [Dokdonia sp. Hel_I_53]|uniref:UvrD-helicase domain-containing protein n=1 Tax=Dokdonia sp. Hel_I_53 TaxID=1566287 RepID=UPI00119A8525|nr:UvrD-helicase domain-containing protein [Dokdonia sp. Hel_I_53]TVZ52614.1 ATP-dependent exoDNAse (exonuclease V) beta subunit [Dokdonia sp. Hel_I_53]